MEIEQSGGGAAFASRLCAGDVIMDKYRVMNQAAAVRGIHEGDKFDGFDCVVEFQAVHLHRNRVDRKSAAG
ncbi:MAG TPA: hypothetical protein VMB85_05645 [Bryobacteraceae bacterium]|nr:hypothetical protein [Bryobacteraceae bacterium]